MSKYNCSVCEDEKHIYDTTKNVWVRCACLAREQFNRKLIESGILYPQEDLDFLKLKSKFPHVSLDDYALETCKTVFDLLKKGTIPNKVICFQGQATGPKDLMVQTILMSAVAGGFTVNQCVMEQLISRQFNDAERASNEEVFRRCNVTSLSFGSESHHNISGDIIIEMVRLKWLFPNNYLILHTNLKWDSIQSKYGSEVLNLFVRRSEKIYKAEKRVVFCPVEK